VIYLTPYIVKKSGDLQHLREMLSELEDIQQKYNAYVRKGLEKEESSWFESSPSDPSAPASKRVNAAPKSNLSILEEGK
jgi:general secretion pathway protein D